MPHLPYAPWRYGAGAPRLARARHLASVRLAEEADTAVRDEWLAVAL